MEAIHALNLNKQTHNNGLGITEIDLNSHKHEKAKRGLSDLNVQHNQAFSRSSSKKFSNAMKLRKQLSTPASTIMEGDDKYKRHGTTDFTKKVRILKRFLKINDTLAAILGIIGLMFAVIEYELFYDDTEKERYTATDNCIMLRSLVSITTAVIILLLTIHSALSYNLFVIQRKENEIENEITYFSSVNFKQLLLEIVIIGIHCPPGWNQVFEFHQLGATVYYSADGILMVWMLLRFYLVFRLFAQYSKWTNELAERCCEPEGCEANTSFAMKAVLKEKPFTSLLCLMMISTIIFGLAVRHFERPYYYGQTPETEGFQDYSYIWNGMWLIMITMMTVGYGDFFPKTHMGRFVCILACFWGVFLVSMMVVTLTVVSSFEQKESKAYDILFRLNIKKDIRKKAAFVVTFAMRIMGLVKKLEKGKISKEQYTKERIFLKSKLDVKLQYYRDAAAKISDYEISSEESLRQLTEKIDRDLDEVKEVLLSLIEMEKQLNEIEQSQITVASAMNECINFSNNLEKHLNIYKENVIRKINLIKKQKEENNENPTIDPDLKAKAKKQSSNDSLQMISSKTKEINKLIEFD